VEGNELVLDDFVCEVVVEGLNSQELDHVDVEQGHHCNVTQLVEVTYSHLILTVYQISIASQVNIFEEESFDFSTFNILNDIFEVIEVESIFNFLVPFAEGVVDRVLEELESFDILLVINDEEGLLTKRVDQQVGCVEKH
jgi:hypothetical protein